MAWTPRTAESAWRDQLTTTVRRHRATARVVVAVTLLTIVIIASRQETTQAGPEPSQEAYASLALPPNIGVGLATDRAVTVQFSQPMDTESVEDLLQVEPATDVYLVWNADRTLVTIAASDRWETDRRYVMTVGPEARTAGGSEIGEATEVSFTTQTAPAVHLFEILSAQGERTAAQPPPEEVVEPETQLEDVEADEPLEQVSTATTVTIEFTTLMDQADVENRFVIEPYVPGTFSWDEQTVSFEPAEPLKPDAAYTVSIAGARDRLGNRVGREAVFTFTTQSGAEVVSVRPGVDDEGSTTDTVTIRFSAPMDTDATGDAFGVFDIQGAAATVPGSVKWDDSETLLTFVASAPLTGGRLHAVRLGPGAVAADGTAVQGEWRFWAVAPEVQVQEDAGDVAAVPEPAAAAPATPQYAPPAYAPGTPLEGYALQQINSARAAYGFPPLSLDPAVSAAASAHAWDQARNNYYSHASLDGRSPSQRLAAAGASFGLSGENQCYYMGMSAIDTLNWCHSAFMAEPYPGHWNHIGNILGKDYTRVGIGVGEANGRVVITWDFVQ